MPGYRYQFSLVPFLMTLALIVLSISACSKRTDLSGNHGSTVFRTLDGRQLVLAEFKRPVLINFWSTSCAICVAEMPQLTKLHQDYSPEGLELIAVAMPHDPPNAVLEFAKARDLPFPVAIDVDGAVLKNFDSVKGTPTSFLFNARGELVSRHVGRMDWEELREEIDGLLHESAHNDAMSTASCPLDACSTAQAPEAG